MHCLACFAKVPRVAKQMWINHFFKAIGNRNLKQFRYDYSNFIVNTWFCCSY